MKEIVVLGDIEMGCGDQNDDFISDRLLSEFILKLAKKKTLVDLILNGDTFDFTISPHYTKSGKRTFPHHITPEIGLDKLKLAIKAHKRMFAALKEFTKKHHLYFTIGNHDPELIFPELQNHLKKVIGTPEHIGFGFSYQYKQVYVEHGHLYDYLNKTDLKEPIYKYKGKKILNLPWLSYALLRQAAKLKVTHPFYERIHPRPLLFSHYRGVMLRTFKDIFTYPLKSLVRYPLSYFGDPTAKLPIELLSHAIEKMKSFNWSLDYTVSVFKESDVFRKSKCTIFVLGHVHKLHVEEVDGKAIMHPGSLRDEYDFDGTTLFPRKKRYVHITLKNNKATFAINEFEHKRSPILFADALKDQWEVMQRAAQEEGYIPLFPYGKKRRINIKKIIKKKRKKSAHNK